MKKYQINDVPNQKNAIVLVVDGLHAGFTGAYGNCGAVTPAFDRLACDSLLCDRYYTDTLDLSLLCREFWYGISPEEAEEETPPVLPGLPERLEEKGYRTILLTDDLEISYNLYAGGFSEVHRIDSAPPEQPAGSPEETQFFRMFATIADLVEKQEKPYFLWCHFKGFAGVWDFPSEYRSEQQEEGDPEPYSGTFVPRRDNRCQDAEPDPDEQQSIAEAYSGGVTVLDEALAGFLESLAGGLSGENTLVIFTASRGFSMGEHRLIGLPDTGGLWAENLHLPLLVRLPRQQDRQRMIRSASLTKPNDIFATLAEWFDERFELSGDDIGGQAGKSLLRLFDDETTQFRNEIPIAGGPTVSAVMRSDWFFRILAETDEFQQRQERIELYAKPGDRYEVNEVADRCGEIIEEFLSGRSIKE